MPDRDVNRLVSASLVERLEQRAAIQGTDDAFIFIDDRGEEQQRLSFLELQRAARDLSGQLLRRGQPGGRAILAFPPGLDFIVAFFGCLYAGLIAVPLLPTRGNRLRESAAAISRDCQPVLGLSVARMVESLGHAFATVPDGPADWLAVDTRAAVADGIGAGITPSAATRETLAFLQYTSGSTSAPKGVMVTHGNLLDNLEMIKNTFGNDRSSTIVSWVPLYHDMGLILNALQAFYAGACCVLMAPVSFLQRPLTWLRAIQHYDARVAGAPNFAFDHCVDRYTPEAARGLDLSSLRVTFNGAEPVRAETLRRFTRTFAPHGFRGESFYPCYGMAEATLLISGGTPGQGPVIFPASASALQLGRVARAAPDERPRELVGCGRTLAGEELAIVDPRTKLPAKPDEIGEIWVRGPHVARGYWRGPDASRDTFAATLANDARREWLRTGDLGWRDNAGELYITGRLKDMLIIRGVNHYPQDIEHTVERSHAALRPHCGAAFAAPRDGIDTLVVVQEVDRAARHAIDIDEVLGCIRAALVHEHELSPFDIALIRTGTIPKTTSGKIRRARTRELWSRGELERLGTEMTARLAS